MRDRLIEILKKRDWLRYLIADTNIERLADILLEAGVIVPTEKVYDIRICKDGLKICEHEVKGIIYDCEYTAFDSRAIGDKIFLTREAAKQALAEREVDNA